MVNIFQYIKTEAAQNKIINILRTERDLKVK